MSLSTGLNPKLDLLTANKLHYLCCCTFRVHQMHAAAPGRLIIWRPFKPIVLKLVWPSAGKF